MSDRNINDEIENYSNSDEIAEEICAGYFDADFGDYKAKYLIHSLINFKEMQIMFMKEDIAYRNKLEKNIRYLIK